MQHFPHTYLTVSIQQKQQSSFVKGGPNDTGLSLLRLRPTNRVSPLPAGSRAALPVARQRSERLGAVCVTELRAKKPTHQLGSRLNRILRLTSQGDKTARTLFFVLTLIISSFRFFFCMARAIGWLRTLSICNVCVCVDVIYVIRNSEINTRLLVILPTAPPTLPELLRM